MYCTIVLNKYIVDPFLRVISITVFIDNKPRTAKVGAISKAQNLKGGPFGLCETPAGCKKFKKIEGRHEKISKKIFLMRFLNSVTVPKNVKGGPFANF